MVNSISNLGLSEEQARFGAMPVPAHDISDIIIRNDDDMSQYHRRIEDVIKGIELLQSDLVKASCIDLFARFKNRPCCDVR